MKLFIIGNGFDLGHGLHTKYEDFRNYLMMKNPSVVDTLQTMFWGAQNELWSDFETNLGKLDGTTINEEIFSRRQEFNNEFDYDALDDDHITRFLESEYYNPLMKLNKLVKDWISTVDVSNLDFILEYANLLNSDAEYVNFNYTLTLEKVYGIPKTHVFHIHGSVDDEPVMGHSKEDELLESSKRDNTGNELDAMFHESFDRLFRNFYDVSTKDTEYFLREMEYFVLPYAEDTSSITVIGHSLGRADLPYFRKLVEMFPKVNWTFSYHNDADLCHLHLTLKNLGIQKFNLKKY